MEEHYYIYKKEVDWSVLREGFSIPVLIQVVFKKLVELFKKRGKEGYKCNTGRTYLSSKINKSVF